MGKVIVIGAGAAGMMAAIAAKRTGANTILLEHKEQVGKKILSTGNGRCNFTNIEQRPECYRGEHPEFGWDTVSRFSAQDTIRFFLKLGIYSKNRNGYLYPYSDQASAVRDVLYMELQRLHVQIETNVEVKEIQKENGFYIRAVRKLMKEERKSKKRTVFVQIGEKEESFEADALVLACGGMAFPVSGSDGSGFLLAKKMGHSIVPCVPALVQLKCEENWIKGLSGIRASAGVRLLAGKEIQAADTGEVQFADYGISGIPVFQISRFASRLLYENKTAERQKKITVEFDFLPEFTEGQLRFFLKNRVENQPECILKSFFTGLFHEKLGRLLVYMAEIDERKPAKTMSEPQMERLISCIKSLPVTISETNGFEQAQVCAGGVATEEIMEGTMESRIVPNLFFAGEIMDIDGMCGGYNLQWAWSSGYLAGACAGKRAGEETV